MTWLQRHPTEAELSTMPLMCSLLDDALEHFFFALRRWSWMTLVYWWLLTVLLWAATAGLF